jgi:prevent-host-death family protein
MRTVNIYDAKTHFSQLINQLISSEKEIIISKAGKPVARLVPYQTPMHERKPGYWRNKIRISPDFDKLPDTVRDAFKGKNA